jgi:hypothetical protein
MLNDGDVACRCCAFRNGMGHLGGVRWHQSAFSPCKPAKVLDIPSAAAFSHGFGKVTRGGAVRTPRRTGDSPPFLGSAC